MKTNLMIFSLLFSSQVFSNSYDSHSFKITGDNTTEQFSLTTELTRRVYDNHKVANTCYRQVHRGYRQECGPRSEVVCRDVIDRRAPTFPPAPGFPPAFPMRRECYTEVRHSCTSVPNYIQEAYTCYSTESVPRDVNDGQYQSDVVVNIINKTDKYTNNICYMTFSQNKSNLSYDAKCDDYLIKKVSEKSKTSNKNLVRTIDLELLDAKKTLAPISHGITELRMQGPVIAFRTGDLDANPRYELIVKVEQQNLLRKDKTIIDRALSPSEYMFERLDDTGGTVRINLDHLAGSIDTKKKYLVRIQIRLLDDLSQIINLSSHSGDVYSEIKTK